MGKNKKCKDIEILNKASNIVIAIIAIIIGMSILYWFYQENTQIFKKYGGIIYIVILIVGMCFIIGGAFMIDMGRIIPIWVNEDKYKKMKCKDI